jgi:hypothetical protein
VYECALVKFDESRVLGSDSKTRFLRVFSLLCERESVIDVWDSW